MQSLTAPALPPSGAQTLSTAITGLFARIASAMRRRRAMRRQARALAALDAASLRDIGLTRTEIGSIASELSGTAPLTRRHAGASSHLPR